MDPMTMMLILGASQSLLGAEQQNKQNKINAIGRYFTGEQSSPKAPTPWSVPVMQAAGAGMQMKQGQQQHEKPWFPAQA